MDGLMCGLEFIRFDASIRGQAFEIPSGVHTFSDQKDQNTSLYIERWQEDSDAT